MLSILVFETGTHALAAATAGASPYQAVVERNVFGLKAPPPPPDPEANKPPPPKIFLQGITTILGNKRALFKMQMPPKPGEQPKGEQGFILAEGQRDGEIEVLEIDAKAGKVKVKNFGQIVDLDFEKDGVKTAAAPAPGGPPKPGGFVPAAPPNPFAPAGGANPIPTARPMRLPTPAGAAATPVSYGGPTTTTAYNPAPAAANYASTPAVVARGSTAGTVALPGLGFTATTPTTQKVLPQDPPMSLEQQAIMDAAYTMKNKAAIEQGTMPAIPGSNPLLDSEPAPGQTTTPANTTTTPPLPPGAARPPILPQ